MNKEELHKLALNSYHEYPLLAELIAIKDDRFKNEQQDSMLCVNGYVSINSLNNYVKLQQENQKYKEIIDNIKYYLEENGNQMSETATYDLMNFIKEV